MEEQAAKAEADRVAAETKKAADMAAALSAKLAQEGAAEAAAEEAAAEAATEEAPATKKLRPLKPPPRRLLPPKPLLKRHRPPRRSPPKMAGRKRRTDPRDHHHTEGLHPRMRAFIPTGPRANLPVHGPRKPSPYRQARPHLGALGELRLHLEAMSPEEIEDHGSLFVDIEGQQVPFFFTSIREHGREGTLIKFDEIDDPRRPPFSWVGRCTCHRACSPTAAMRVGTLSRWWACSWWIGGRQGRSAR